VVSRGIATLSLIVALGAPAAAAGPTESRGEGSVRIAQLSPLVVAGSGFGRAERLAITARGDFGTATRRQRASLRGAFVARFQDTTVDRCGGQLTVVVQGASGAVAKVRRPPFYCPPGVP
jgi:hypothetical protein